MLRQGVEIEFLFLVLGGKAVQTSADMDNLTACNSPLDKAVPPVLAIRKQGCRLMAGKIAVWGIFKDFFRQFVHILLIRPSSYDSIWKLYDISAYIARRFNKTV